MKSVYKKIKKIEARANEVMCLDKPRIYRALGKIKKAVKESTPDEVLKEKLENITSAIDASRKRTEKRKKGVPLPSYNNALPITARKDDIIEAIRSKQVVIISGETGSGKTTQLPKFCLEAGRGISGKIGCTQPRRIAAITIADRISQELGEPRGQSVGYKIRFQDNVGPDAYIKIMTDGILLMEAHQNRYLNEYDTIIIDEAHERSLNIDFCIGILNTLLPKRPDLKLIITSATIDTGKFSKAFDNAPVIEVSGRMYPVEVRYSSDDTDDAEDESTHVDMAVDTVERLHRQTASGDILVFMPTEQDILETCDLISGRYLKNTIVMPLFARLPAKDQSGVFIKTGTRKIIVATNIAETSITIPGIKYVVDTGLARVSRYSPHSRTTSLPVVPISKSSADQRKGRCGRVENGVCIRLFSEKDLESRPLFTSPEILRANLADVALRMTSLKLGEISDFPFIDHPPKKYIKDGYDLLFELGAIRAAHGNRKYALTPKGAVMARIPIDPVLSAMLIEADKLGCISEISVITSVLSIRDPRERPPGKEADADNAHEKFRNSQSDFITLLNIWNAYHQTLAEVKSGNQMKKFCKDNYLSFRRMREWRDIHKQIVAILKEHGIQSRKRRISIENHDGVNGFSPFYAALHKSILSGFLSNIAVKKENNIFRATKEREVMIFPGSTLFNQPGKWIVASEFVETSRLFARMAASIDSEWIEGPAQALLKKTWLHPRWERNKGEVMADEQVSLFGLIIVPKRPVVFGNIDPETASEIFIRKAIIEADVKTPLPFMKHNRSLLDHVKTMEDKIRKRDILVGEEDLFHFYNTRIPGIYNFKGLKKIIRENGGDNFLKMTEDDLFSYRPDQDELSLFPDSIVLGDNQYECEYNFNPGQDDDGITLKVPAHRAEHITASKLDWMVPGVLQEKITAMIKGLPKDIRKQLVPVNTTVDIIVNEMPRNRNISFHQALCNFIYERFKVHIPQTAWPGDLPQHLTMRIAITDPKGNTVLCSRDKNVLKKTIPFGNGSNAYEKAKKKWERSGVTTWDFPDLPEHITIKEDDGDTIALFPGLHDTNGTIDLRLFRSRTNAAKYHKKGVMGLYCIHFSKDLKFLKKNLSLDDPFKAASSCLGGHKHIEHHLYRRVILDLFRKNIRSSKDFYGYAESIASDIIPAGRLLKENAMPVIAAVSETAETVRRLGNKADNVLRPVFSALQNELAALVPGNFIEVYESKHFPHITRYIKGVGIRAGRALDNPEKERVKAEKIKPYDTALKRILNELTEDSTEEKKQETEAFFWMLEEYKISVFAQEVKTAHPISPKKLDHQLKLIRRMV